MATGDQTYHYGLVAQAYSHLLRTHAPHPMKIVRAVVSRAIEGTEDNRERMKNVVVIGRALTVPGYTFTTTDGTFSDASEAIDSAFQGENHTITINSDDKFNGFVLDLSFDKARAEARAEASLNGHYG